MFKTLLENCIVKHGPDYKCCICHRKLSSCNFEAVLDKHKKGRYHMMQADLHAWDKQPVTEELKRLISLSETEYQELVENNIIYKISYYYCNFCKCKISSPTVHMNEKFHKHRYEANNANQSETNVENEKKNFKPNETIKKMESLIKIIRPTEIPVIEASTLENKLSFQTHVTFIESTKSYKCEPCNRLFSKKRNIYRHIANSGHKQKIAAQQVQSVLSGNRELKRIIKKAVQDKNKYFYCKKCNAYLTMDSILLYCHCLLHLYEEQPNLDSDIIIFYFNDDKKVNIKCLPCNVTMNSDKTFATHVKTNTHQKNIGDLRKICKNKNNTFSKSLSKKVNDVTKLNSYIFNPTIDIYIKDYCTICYEKAIIIDLNESDIQNLEQKQKSLDEFQIDKQDHSHSTINLEKYSNFYKCFLCDKLFHSIEILLRHYNRASHKLKLKIFYIILSEQLDSSDTDTESSSAEDINVMDIIQSESSNSNTETSSTEDINVMDILQLESSNSNTEPSSAEDNIVMDTIQLESNDLNTRPSYTEDNNVMDIKQLDSSNSNKQPTYAEDNNVTSTAQLDPSNLNAQPSHDEDNNVTNTTQLDPSNSNVQPSLQPSSAKNKLNKTSTNLNSKKQLLKKQKKIKEKPNRRLPYNRDIVDFGNKYVSMCLESGNENIYNIDDETIRRLQFGVSLIFTSKSDRICIPCEYKIPLNFYYLYEHLQHEVHIQNLCDIEEDNNDFNEYQDQFSDLELAKSCMQEESDKWVKCYGCDETVPNFDDEIKTHMNSVTHISKIKSWKKNSEYINENFSIIFKDSWYFVEKFYCKMCNLTFNREIHFAKHLKQSEHLEKVKLHKKVNNKINICYACSSCWYGESNYSQHYNEYAHLSFIKKHNEILPKMSRSANNFLDFVDEKVKDLLKNSDEVALKQRYKEKQLLKSVEETVRPVYPNAKAYSFGSRSSFLGFNTSDVDVFLDCENKYNNIGSKEESQKYIRSIKNHFFKKNINIWKRDQILLNPRVPIIKSEHRRTHLKCDISFLSGLGVEKSKLIRNYVTAYLHCRELILYLKKWFAVCDLYGPQAVNAYAISWYAIFYLQSKGILPSVHQLIELNDKSKIVDGWQCGFSQIGPVTSTNNTFKDILQGFFSYYAEFNYCTDVICPFLGKVIKKREFVQIDDLPEKMEIYKYRLKTEDNIEFFRFDSPMCIQDPVDLSQNITKAITKLQLRYFRSFCVKSSKKLLTEKETERTEQNI